MSGAVIKSRKSAVKAKTAAVAKPGKQVTGSRSSALGKANGKPRGDTRRTAILRALHSCVLDKGYAKTSLADIAGAAGMYPSHLLYYFKGKEAILEQYFQDVSQKILERLHAFTAEDPKRQIELLANLFFAGKGIKKSEIGFMLESFGVAVNDKVLREEKATLDRQCKEYLGQLFEKSPGRIMNEPRDCAEITYSMLIGLRSAVYFDENLELPDAYRLFHAAVIHLAGYS